MASEGGQDNEQAVIPYSVEYAKSGRSSCKGCKESIAQGSLRMSLRAPSHFFDGWQDNWFHFRCFWPKIKKGGNQINEASIRGMDFLKWDDQEKVRQKIAEHAATGDGPEVSSTPPKIEYAKTSRGKCSQCKEAIQKGEAKLGIKSAYYHAECFKKVHESAIKDVTSIDGFENLEKKEKDSLKKTFKKANEKKSKRKGKEPEEEPAAKVQKIEEPAPVADPKLMKRLKKQAEEIWKVRQCLEANVSSSGLRQLLEANDQQAPSHHMLERLVDCIIFGCPKKCERCTGQVAFSISHQTYKCEGYITAYTKCMYECRNPPRTKFIFPEEMLKSIDALSAIKVKGVKERLYNATNEKIVQPKSFAAIGSRSEKKEQSGKQVQTLKDGAVVDPACEVADVAHVWRDKKGTLWQATLGSTDVATSKNSFYKLQLLCHDTQQMFYLFRSWGRIGTSNGGSKTDTYHSALSSAQSEFKKHFLDKSGNEWEKRENFEKVAGKMSMLEMNINEDELATPGVSDVKPGSLSKLHKSIQEVVTMIFDVNSMTKALHQFEIDTEKMPLGKLSKRQLRNAYKVLTDLQQLIANGAADREQFIDATNQFYTFVPHCFKMGQKPPILDSTQKIEEKTKMIDELMEIEIAYSLLKSNTASDKERDPIDVHYEKLNAAMEVLDKKGEEFKQIVKYVANTHAKTHSYYKLSVKDVIRVQREGESKRFKADIRNRHLLWHGSRMTNYAGILSQGLRIAPPEAPVTGYMFGKGVYFADMVSKSANYCYVSEGEGFLLLCDVALGSMQEETHAKYIEKLEAGKSSCKGVGRTMPNPKEAVVTEDGVTIPMGKPVDTGRGDLSLLYNEYIIYDVAQVEIKYLVRLQFDRA